MIKTTVVERTAAHLQRELNRLEDEKEKVRRALAAIQSIFGTGNGIRALRHSRSKRAMPKLRQAQAEQRKVTLSGKRGHARNAGLAKCLLCGKEFRRYRRDQVFCANPCKSNSRGAMKVRQAMREKAERKAEKKGTVLVSGDPLRPSPDNG